MLLSLVLGAGLASASASASAARDIFVLEDPRGDDFGAGDLVYPNSGVIERGTLDLVSLRAYADKDGTWFRARMARRIASPKGLTTYIGKEPLDKLARHGFFTFNIDIYIDQDRVAGSGRVDTLPGRKVEVAFEDAWEKTVVLTPRPEVARAYYKVHLEGQAEDALRAEFGKVTAEQLREAQDRVEEQLTEEFLFPNKIRVRGSREIEFFVPDSFLGGPASPEWSYSVLVTGCEVEQLSKVVNLTPGEFSLMVIPAAFGRHSERFGIINDGDVNQPPVIDLLASSVAQQQRALSDYNVVEQRLAAVPGISPAGVGSVAGAPGQAGPVARQPPGAGSVPTPAAPTPRVGGVAPAAVSPTPADPGRRTIPDRLRTLNALRDDGLVTEQEYQALRRKILAEL